MQIRCAEAYGSGRRRSCHDLQRRRINEFRLLSSGKIAAPRRHTPATGPSVWKSSHCIDIASFSPGVLRPTSTPSSSDR